MPAVTFWFVAMSQFPAGRTTAEELFGPAGTPTVVVIGAGFGGIAAGVKLKRAGIRHVHDLRVVARDRRHVVGQHLSGRRGRRRLAPLLLLVQGRTTGRARTPGSPSCSSTSRKRSTSSASAPHLQLGVTVESATWDDERHVWDVAASPTVASRSATCS